MAEAWARNLHGDKYNFYSAGTKKQGLNQRAVAVMKEVGIDMSSHSSKTTEELSTSHMDYVFTVCSEAHENCPYFSGEKIIHIGFDDPPRLTKDMKDEKEIFSVYRRVRDEIKSTIANLQNYMEI